MDAKNYLVLMKNRHEGSEQEAGEEGLEKGLSMGHFKGAEEGRGKGQRGSLLTPKDWPWTPTVEPA